MSGILPLKILKASAGSGKTFSLAVHYLTLLFHHEYKYREILAVTFTNKATEEMKTRILDVLKGLANNDPSPGTDNYRQLLLKAYPQYSDIELQERAQKIYRRILHDYSHFSVSTIDGFVQKVIRGFAFELGLDAAYSLEMNLDKVQDQLVDRLDVELDDKPELVEWIVDLAKERIDNDKSWNYKGELLSLTREIFKERFADFETGLNEIGYSNIEKEFSKYVQLTKQHIRSVEEALVSKAQSVLRAFRDSNLSTDDLKGKSRNPLLKLTKITEKDFGQISSLHKLIDTPEEWFQKNTDSSPFYSINPLLKDLCTYFQHQEGPYILATQFQNNVYYLRLMQELALLLRTYREESGNLLISDAQHLLTGITEDAGDNPSFIWEKIGNRYRNFLFDEFQDTSVSQWKSFRSLVQNAISAPSEEFIDHLIVGDTKQSIYRWRNGDWSILESGAKADLGSHHIVDDNLEDNHRSSTAIIEFNNFLYASFPRLLQDKLNLLVAETEKTELLDWWVAKGYHDIINSIFENVRQNTTPRTPEGGIIKISKFSKQEEEERIFSDSVFREYALKDTIEEIRRIQQDFHYTYSEMCVLVRTNGEAESVVNELMAAGIPVVSGDALMIANSTAIKLIINTLYILVGYDENTSLYKANCISLYHKIRDIAIDPDIFLTIKGKSLSQLSGILPPALCEEANNWMQLPLPELVERIIHAYGLDQKQEYLAYLLSFRDITANATKQGEKGILSFLNWWEEDGVRKTLPSPDAANAVQVMTIHKSKGLAFRAVFIPFCNLDLGGKTNGIFWVPAINTPYEALKSIPLKYKDELAKSSVANYYFEENLYSHIDALNMIYVATTRAKDYLYIGIKEKKDLKKISNTGDLFQLVLAEHFESEDVYNIEKPVQTDRKQNSSQTIGMHFYPTSDRLSDIYIPREEKNAAHVLHIGQAGRQGSILHTILADIKSLAELPSYLDSLLLEGAIMEDEKTFFMQEATRVLQHEQLNELLSKAEQHFSERSIVSADGHVYRPDKILIQDNFVAVIDYKFTFQEHPEHLDQVRIYMDLLGKMGYKDVEGYLFYATTNTLKPVI
ncbi:UvrD-helicase domain-containing protein [Sphingobacterium spiritivorum]|uniref:UvrD-helicase domain-containing protein n=1 Tax=Sphingobacterium spiritivorum TaxID=258 RepID=UPI003DA3B977